MKLKPTLYAIVLLAGIAGFIIWTLFQVRSVLLAEDQRWIGHVSDLIVDQREGLADWIRRFPVKTSTFRTIANSRANVSGLMLSDRKRIQSMHWVRPGLEGLVKPTDPRLSVLQLAAMDRQETVTGPVVFCRGKPFFTLARPLDKNRALIVFLDARRFWEVLGKQASAGKVRATVFDFESHPLFSSAKLLLSRAALEEMIRRVRNKETSGVVGLRGDLAGKWLVTFHYDPASDWTFVLTHDAASVKATTPRFVNPRWILWMENYAMDREY